MNAIYLVQHVHLLDEDEEDVKTIGIYSTEQLAREAVARLRLQPGFCDTPEGFHADQYKMNKDHWEEGFVTICASDFDQEDENGN